MKILVPLIALLTVSNIQNCNNRTGVPKTFSLDDSIKYPPLPAQLFLLTDDAWNTPVDNADTDTNSAVIIKNIQSGIPDSQQKVIVDLSVPYYVVNNPDRPVSIRGITTDGGADGNYGVPEDTLKFPELSGKKPQTSDPHLLIIDTGSQKLYELYNPQPVTTQTEMWLHHGAAIFDLSQNIPSREDGYTSADAAGLPVLPGLLRFEELRSGEIKHALRVTLSDSQTVNAHVSPATHNPTSGYLYDSTKPLLHLPMGARLRLKNSFPDTSFPPEAKTIIRCLKKYGMIVADIGPSFNISGTSDPRFNSKFSGYITYRGDSTSQTLHLYDGNGKDISWSNFEVIKMGKASNTVRQYP